MTVSRHTIATVADTTIPVTFTWDAADPYAIRMDLHGAEKVTWRFAVDLLADGLCQTAGLGDVRISPSGPGRTVIVLDGPGGRAVLTVPTVTLQSLLDDTWAVEMTIPDFVPELTDEALGEEA